MVGEISVEIGYEEAIYIMGWILAIQVALKLA